MVLSALEIGFALHNATILTLRLIQFHTNPLSRSKTSHTHKPIGYIKT